MVGTEPLNEEAVPRTEKPQGAWVGGYNGLTKKLL